MKDYLILESLELSELIEKTLRKVLEEHQAPDPALRETPAEIISIDQAVELLNLAKPTIYALTSRGEIPFFKTGKKLYFKRSELLAWIEQGKKGAHIGQPAKNRKK